MVLRAFERPRQGVVMSDRTSATTAAQWLVRRATDAGVPLTNLKLQKLLYYAHGYYLVRHHEPLVRDGFQAWDNGPVCPQVYKAFKSYGSAQIDNIAVDGERVESRLGSDAVEVLHEVWDRFGSWTATELWNSTHTIGWDQVYEPNARNIAIDDALIEDSFRRLPDALPADADDRQRRYAESMAALRQRHAARKQAKREVVGDAGILEDLDDWSASRAVATSGLLGRD
jgi:uncharacterized phage-associated protein